MQAFPYLPYSQVFPRAAAVVHQAGIGTLALRAGCPHEYVYGPAGLETSISYDFMSGTRIALQFVYEFDEQGNWIRKTTSQCRAGQDEFGAVWQDPNPCEVMMRTITYYNAPQNGDGFK